MSDAAPDGDAKPPLEPPPFLGRWSRVYLLVLGTEAVVIALLALFGAFAS